MVSKLTCGIITSVFAVFGIIAGGVTLGTFSTIFNAILKSVLTVAPDSYSYSIWKEMPLPFYMSIYFFNITNWEDIKNRVPGVKPNLVQVGPYVWRQYQVMDDILWSDGKGTVSYKQNKTYEWQPDMSNGTLDDIIVTINIVAVGATEYARHQPALVAQSMNVLFDSIPGVELFFKYPVRNYTFDGILDPIMEATATMPVPIPMPYDKFGWFYGRDGNDDFDGNYTMYTGESGLDKLGQIVTWNNSPHVPKKMYTGNCGEITGSAGTFFPAHPSKTYIDYFSSDVCRSLRYKYQHEVEVKGVTGYKYSLDADMVDNRLSDHFCYNPYPDPDLSLYSGLMNVSACKYDSPAYVSYPHFLHGDIELLHQFTSESMQPSLSKHESYLVLEPTSGIPLEVAIRLQINTLLRPLTRHFDGDDSSQTFDINLLKGLDTIYYPMIWFETVVRLDDDMASQMRLMTSAPKIGLGVGIGMIVVGTILGVVATALFIKHRQYLNSV